MGHFAPNHLTGALVVALVYGGLCTFEFSIVAEIFGLPRPEPGHGWYRFASAAVEPGPMRAHGGLTVTSDGGADLIDQADIIVAAGWKGWDVDLPLTLIERLKRAHERGARLASICSGSFVLAATGLLDGKRAATHWQYAERLASRHPQVTVDADVLYVQEGRVFTSAGSAAGIDLMLHIIRQDFGLAAANSVARRLVMPAHRAGGQAQFIERPVPAEHRSKLSGLLDRIRADPCDDWTVERMASAAAMSKRTFLRHFIECTGTPPAEWVVRTRLDEAKRLLETTRLPIEDISLKAGLGSVETLRRHFRQHVGVSPREYREAFS